MSSINERRFRLSRNIERKLLPDGTLLMKQTVRGEYLALRPDQQVLLDTFSGGPTVQEILQVQLLQKGHLKIRAFYDLVINALDKGFLVEGDAEPATTPATSYRWRVRWGATSAIGLSVAMILAGASALWSMPITLVHSWADWLTVLLFMMLALSLSNALAGCVLSGFGRLVSGVRVRVGWGIPFFAVNTSDAFMGGRLCEICVALQALATPFVVALGAMVWDSPSGLLAGWITVLMVGSPFGNTPAHRVLHAWCRKDYQLPRCAEKFMRSRMVSQLFKWNDSLREETYFLVYSTYAILWLGAAFRFASQLFDLQQMHMIQDWLRPDKPGAFWGPLAEFLAFVLLVGAPVVYLGLVLIRGLHRVAAARWFTAENSLDRKQAGGTRPSGGDILKFLQNTPLFSQLLAADLSQVANAMNYVRVHPGGWIIRENELGESLFVILGGKVEVLKENEAGEPRCVATLGRGDVFGEIALLDHVPRTASSRAVETTDLLTLSKADFERVLVSALGAAPIKSAVQVSAFLKRNPLFADWHPQPLIKLSNEFSFAEYKSGEVVIRENQPNDSFFLVYEGEFHVRKSGESRAILRAGDFCGEISLLRDTPATADVIAARTGRCLKLSKASFMRLVSQDFLTGLVIETTAETRMRERHAA